MSLEGALHIRTYIKIQTPAYRPQTPLDKVTSPFSDAVQRLPTDNVGVGVAVGQDAFSLSMLQHPIRPKRHGDESSQWTYIVLVQSGEHGPDTTVSNNPDAGVHQHTSVRKS